MLLSAEQLSINFGSRQLLQDVDFYLNEGDKTGVIGINGTGKSTFLKVLAGLVQPDSGYISRRPNLQVSYLPQNPEMDDDRTILEQVFASMPPQFRALNEYEAKAMLTKLGLGETDRRIGTLSGGERRRAALCAALIHPADVLVLDEPTNHLDTEMVAWLEDWLRRGRWPGNIRELQNVIQNMMLRVGETEEEVSCTHIPAYALEIQPDSGAPQPPSPEDSPQQWDLNGLLRAYQRRLLVQALEQSGGNMTRAAASLGIGRQNLLARMKRLNVEKPSGQ